MTHHRGARPNLSWVRAAEAGGQGASCCVEAGPRWLTLGPDPDPLPYCGGQAQSPEDQGLLRRTGDEPAFMVAQPSAASISGLTTRDRAGQPGQAPAAGHRSESESSRAH